ncbi:hypothetical protein HPB48_018493 [Haemaphysalis longicornis]|uniref:Uncharacterized protein n=1 Tax=Haemaphysalis longicornis TaxID=44386 RepID=A0A9J6GCH5_HAELO|nr:hypothetical protein HPB48_018493 [Haemaphysalis longicornis]
MSDAYNALLSGKVKQVVSFKSGSRSEGVVVVLATVEASQALDKAYTPWLGECCTHVAALLLYVQASAAHGLNTESPTKKVCWWLEVPKTSRVTAPKTLLLSSITDTEETDSAPEAAAEQPKRQEQPPESSPLRLGFYTNVSLEAAKEVQLTSEQCDEIELNTRGQSRSPEWLQERQGKITASVLPPCSCMPNCADGARSRTYGLHKDTSSREPSVRL